MMKLVG